MGYKTLDFLYKTCIIMIMKTIHKSITNRRPAFIDTEAHQALPVLSEILTQEKGVNISYIEAASIAIKEATERRQKIIARRQARLEQREATAV